MYHSDSDESLHQYRLRHQPLRPQSTLSLNQLCSRRQSNPDVYPGARRFSTSYSHEDILSNDQLDQIHFDPRYRDYRSASSLNNSYNRTRSNSLNSTGSGGNIINQYQQFRRLSNQSPPLYGGGRLSTHSPPLLGAPLAPQKRWDTNPSIFIEEYKDDPSKSISDPKTESHHSRETLCSSNESLQPLSEGDIKSFGDLSAIPFIDDDSNESAPCRFADDDIDRKSCGIMSSGTGRNVCPRKTVSFDVIAGGPTVHRQLFTNNGKHSPRNPNSIPKPTDKNPLFHGSHRFRANVRPSRDGIIHNTMQSSHPQSVPRSSSCDDDHCTLVDKLRRLRLEEEVKQMMSPRLDYKIKWDGVDESRVCEGKVKALTTYFNSLPYMADDCHCVGVHQSTPDLSRNSSKLTDDEMSIVRRQLKEWSEFGLKTATSDHSPCSFLEQASTSPSVCLENEKFNDCRQYHDVLNKLDKVELRRRRNFHRSLSNIYNPTLSDCFFIPSHHCHSVCPNIGEKATHVRPTMMRSEKHKCRSACFNIKDPAKQKRKREMRMAKSSAEDDNESFVI